jgi:predicted ester cyclase
MPASTSISAMKSSNPPSEAEVDVKAVVRALVEAWNGHDVELICSFFHDDFENDQIPLPVVRGIDAYRDHLRHWFASYPDLRLEIVTLFAEGDLVCLETRGYGTPSGSFFESEPSVPGINRALDILLLKDGKVWRERGYWDFSLWTGGEAVPLIRPREDRDDRLSSATNPPD